jgi:hypothetical protein
VLCARRAPELYNWVGEPGAQHQFVTPAPIGFRAPLPSAPRRTVRQTGRHTNEIPQSPHAQIARPTDPQFGREPKRYLEDRSIWEHIKEEARCCATVSIMYRSLVSGLLQTEPKYTRQDMVTIISGNIEAWLGLSAVCAYLFFERFYDALVEARRGLGAAGGRGGTEGAACRRRRRRSTAGAASSSSSAARPGRDHGSGLTRNRRRPRHATAGRASPLRCRGGWSPLPLGVIWVRVAGLIGVSISILTKVKNKLAQLFTYLSRRR